MRKVPIALGVFFLVALLFVVSGINRLPTLEEDVKAKWSQVENTYQRRADLIPNLVEAVKGYAAHERETLTAVIQARAHATQIRVPESMLTDPDALRKYQEAQGQLGAALGRLMMVSEQYPALKADANFLALQSQLEGTENRIAVARRDYILAVQTFNTSIRTFPGVVWNLLCGLTPMAQFAAEESAKAPPRVKF